ncbi:Fe-S cluster assembly protein SufD [Methylomagnum ishizawai]|uniref:Fe-S cluster assembly protein SufD n=1 Tax=Methylomagnum ishizawai TaxID=1760988 RepID=A0A1Y6D1D0_9GAMM|nr:Fe-S cluster assembly protein SufD [Methylomagnum ishizawai]SMF96396.1 Fe-S cluster assembly protein SufD [Methylomagnum ishizawai]
MDYAEHYQTTARDLPGQDLPWLQTLRTQAAGRFVMGGFPSPREEEWKYTNIVPIEKKRFQANVTGAADSLDPARIAAWRLPEVAGLVFVDGRFNAELSNLAGLPDGVTVLPLTAALVECPERVEPVFQRSAGRETHGFVAFNTAYFQDGAFISLAAGVVLEQPLQLLHVSTRNDGLATLRHVIALDRQAQAQIVETYVGLDGAASLTAAVTEIDLGENAILDHYKLQAETDKAYHFGGIYAGQARSARLYQHHAAFGGLLARTEIHSALGQGAECELNGLFLATGRRHLDTHTLIQHQAPRGTSRETYRGIAADRARGVFAGKVVVAQDAQKTDADMSIRNLLLSADAEIDAKPQLEILADDVKCAHGVTVGQLDPQSVFYLQSRGVDAASARNMLTFAFANEMVEKIRLDGLKRQVQDALLAALPQADIRGDWL